jgi:predicted phosphodiesterase
MSKPTLSGEVVLHYLAKYKDMPTRTLAKLLRKEHPLVFSSIDHARGRIRYYLGTSGEKSRGHLSAESGRFALPAPTDDNPHSLPESDMVPWLPFDIGSEYTRCFVIADTHVPYHNMEALNAAMSAGKEYRPNCVILDGDMWDCYALSRWEKNPEARDFPNERTKMRHFLMALREAFPSARIIYKQGNHEERFDNYLVSHAPDFFGLPECTVPGMLKLGELEIEWVADRRYLTVGKLNILHGHEMDRNSGAAVNPARTAFLKLKECSLTAHNHQVSTHSEPTLRGKLVSCSSVGCLSELHPQYMPINKWSHGFATIDQYGEDDFDLRNYKIIKGKVVNT